MRWALHRLPLAGCIALKYGSRYEYEAEISLAEEMAFHARCRGVRYRERYKEFMLWDCLRQRHTGRVAPRPPLVLAVKLDGKLNKWPGDAEAPPILVSSELCAESGALEYPLHLL